MSLVRVSQKGAFDRRGIDGWMGRALRGSAAAGVPPKSQQLTAVSRATINPLGLDTTSVPQ